MAVQLLQDWCKGMDMDPKKALLIVGIPVQCSEAEIKETLRAGLHLLSTYRLVGRIFRREDNAKAILIQLADPVHYPVIPSCVAGTGGAWEVVAQPRSSDEEFLSRLKYFLKDEGRRMEDVARSLGFSALSGEDVGAGPVGEKPRREAGWYRKPKVFSGSPSPGPGEEAFEAWLEQATELLQLWQVSEAEKLRRLLESLRGPALSAVRVLRAQNHSISVGQCLDALREIYGSREHPETEKSMFLQTCQTSEETVCAFLLRIEPLLQKVARHSPFLGQSTDSVRLKHVLTRASMPAAFRSKLELLDQQGSPPTFLELVKLVREQEAWENTEARKREKQKQEERSLRASGRQEEAQAGGPVAQGPALEEPVATARSDLAESRAQIMRRGIRSIRKRPRLLSTQDKGEDSHS
ncbi:paraneoplastic antigen-like protein 5, partial [Octodon degus]|uniref:Paraneoplastic antigen-like protein 5 n=1 Tax=Octodon degus TaxID=10160 RepID=A0A6P3FJX5_OCTDE